MKEFKTYHPIVNFTYFLFVIAFSMFFMHPVCLVISVVSSFTYSVILNGRKSLKFNIIYILPLMIVTALLNPVFNHEGVTILTYLPSGNPLTAEAIIYGFASAVMLASVILWFSCFNKIMTSDKFMYLFGRIIPSISLILSTVLRFIPKFKKDLKDIINSQKCLGKTFDKSSFIKKIKLSVTVISSLITCSLENAIDTADSMKSRGYGVCRRTSYSYYKFSKRDALIMCFLIIQIIYVLFGAKFNKISFVYYPNLSGADFSYYGLNVFIAYFRLCIKPVIIEFKEEISWKALKSKI